MIIFLLKSAACMAIFLVFYKLFLENESMHNFKRYFLLAAIAISLVIPLVVFTEVVYIAPISTSFTLTEDYSLETYHTPSIEPIDYTYWSLLSIYSLGVLFFSLQFFKNLYQIKNTIQNNPKQQTNSIIKVLLSLQIVPHTFFNYIFLNKQKFEANEIPPAVLLHEETHAKQKHSIDILVLEILQIVLWFNPLIYLFKKSIKLNHEFLADSAVLNNGLEKSDYQKILLAFSSNATEPQLANAINYSSIKKRFTVMKKETSRKVSLIKSLLIIPIAAILLLGFSEKETLEIQKEGTPQEQQTLLSGIKKELENVDALKLNYTDTHDVANNNSNLKNFEFQISRINHGLRLESMIGSNWKELELNLPNNQPQLIDKSGLVKFNNTGGIKNSQDFLITIQKTEKEIFLKGLSGTRWVELSFTLSENGRQKVNENGMVISKEENDAQQEAILKYNSLAKKYNAIPIEKRIIPLKDLYLLENIYRNMSPAQKEAAQPFPECLPKANQDGATKKQITTYNDLAKKYNTMMAKGGNIRIVKSDVDRLTYIYGIMSDKQKASAQPFPDFPEPPPAPKAPNTSDYADAEINRVIKTQDPYDHNNLDLKAVNGIPPTTNTFYSGSDIENMRVYIYNSSSSKLDNSPSLMKNLRSLEKQDAQFFFDGKKITSEEGFQIIKNETNIKVETLPYTNKQPEVRIYKENNDLRIPPPPASPTPPSPLDYVINAAKKGATFMYEGEKVSSDKAIDLLKNNKELNIESRNKNGKQIVRITKDPVTIE